MADQKFKSKVKLQGGGNLPNETASTVLVLDASKDLVSGGATTTELGYLAGVTSAIQTQLNANATAISDHIADATDAHAGTAITNTPAGTIAATTVQAAINELDGDVQAVTADVADLVTLSGVAANEPDLGTFTGTIIPDDSTIKAALQALETAIVADSVTSVNGQTGVVVLTTTDIAEGTNLYFTAEAAQDSVGTILTDSNTIDFTYTDATPTITADVITQMSITSDASGIKLVNDAATPGNTKYYGTDGSGTKGFFAITPVLTGGDLAEASFAAANNQAAPADVTGFAFAAASVRSFKALVSVEIDATTDLYEAFELVGINKNGTFDMAISAVGDDSGIAFSITNAGQIQYTSTNLAGFVTDTIRFRAITTNF